MWRPDGAWNGLVAKTYVGTGSRPAPESFRYGVLATASLPYWTVHVPPPSVRSVPLMEAGPETAPDPAPREIRARRAVAGLPDLARVITPRRRR